MSLWKFIFAGGARARIAVLLIAAAVDLLVGDPHWLWHPVQGIGMLIDVSESFFRNLFGVPWTEEKRGKEGAERAVPADTGNRDRGRRERLAGICMVLTVLAAGVGITLLLLYICARIHPWLRVLAEGILCGRLLALRSLGEAGRSVRDPLRAGDLEGARKAVSMIVGRDTERLDAEGIGKAAVETVAENTSDGVTAPLFYMVLFGGAGGIFYKAVNTMDSMTGYKNRRYRYFGTAAARLDDVLNFIPSRLTALFMILACWLPVPLLDRKADRAPDGRSAFRIWKRDRRKSPSPNSAQTESVCAGALHLRLLGDTWYFGELHHKEEIGDGLRPVETEDITRAVRLMNGTSGLMYAVSICVLLLIVMLTASGCAGNTGPAGKQTDSAQTKVEETQNETDGAQTEAEETQNETDGAQTEAEETQNETDSAQTGAGTPAPGTYTPASFTVRGGTGKVTITCPEVTISDSGDPEAAEALLVFSSPHYEWVRTGGVQFDPVNAEDADRKTSEFRIPAVLEEEMEIIGLTTAMSEPHEITYTIRISLTETEAEATDRETETEAEAPQTEDPEAEDPETPEEESRNTDLSAEAAVSGAEPPQIPGLCFVSAMELTYAQTFDIFYYEKDLSAEGNRKGGSVEEGEKDPSGERELFPLIDVHGSARYLLLPDGEEVPEGIPKEIVILRTPLKNIYVAATSSMALFDAAGALDQIRLTGTDEKGWYIDAPKKALQEGRMVYAGKYSSPDYELLTAYGCDLAVESTMILHSPEVKEKLEELGIPVFIDTSSTESHPLGRTEWVRLYGVLTGHSEQADAFFAQQAEKLADADTYADTGKTVAFFSITSTGNVIVRASEDYIPRMIALAGGSYIFRDLENASGSSASVRLSMETFYSEAKDADYLIYNATIESPVRSLSELVGKSGLLSDFKAVQDGNVWQIRRSLYQSPDIAAEMITDIHGMLTGAPQEDMVFLEKIE